MYKINEDLAEETGIHIGDGSMNIYNGVHAYTIACHHIDDRRYMDSISWEVKAIVCNKDGTLIGSGLDDEIRKLLSTCENLCLIVFESGNVNELPLCGDGLCASRYENYESCPEDCSFCSQ